MTLTETTDNVLYYSCLDKHDEHTFKYSIAEKKWEKIIIKSKLILHYNEDPCEGAIIEFATGNNEIKEVSSATMSELETISNLTEIKGIGAKRAEELELAGIITISDLAKCSPKIISEKTGIPLSKISMWIIEANNLTKKAMILSA